MKEMAKEMQKECCLNSVTKGIMKVCKKDLNNKKRREKIGGNKTEIGFVSETRSDDRHEKVIQIILGQLQHKLEFENID